MYALTMPILSFATSNPGKNWFPVNAILSGSVSPNKYTAGMPGGYTH
jgi:hypothetical protein